VWGDARKSSLCTGQVQLLHRPGKVWGATGQAAPRCAAWRSAPTANALSPGSEDQTAKVWDAATGQEIFTLKGHAGYVRSVAFSPDGQRIVTASNDQTAKLWDATTGQEVPTLKGHADFVNSIAFSPDSQWMVTGSGDGTARVWDVEKGQEVLALGSVTEWSVAGVWSVAFSPDGQRIVTGSQDKTAKVWDATTGQELLRLKHTQRNIERGVQPRRPTHRHRRG
jgi:eukaryotic-like serine/threonine-protein kinase